MGTALLRSPKTARPRNDAEFRLTCAIADHLRLRACKGVVWFHIPNGEKRSLRTGGRLKAMGVRAGVADFMVQVPDARSAMLEVKAYGGRQTPEQRIFQRDWEATGGRYVVAEGIDQALEALRSWGALPADYARPAKNQPNLPLEAA